MINPRTVEYQSRNGGDLENQANFESVPNIQSQPNRESHANVERQANRTSYGTNDGTLMEDKLAPRICNTCNTTPNVHIFLRPMAPPGALGLAGFAGSTWIVATWIAGWWGSSTSATLFFPFVFMFGGVGQFIAGIMGYWARDSLVTVIHTVWGSFWISVGLLYAFVAAGAVNTPDIHGEFEELATWLVVMTAFTWICAVAAVSRDLVLMITYTLMAIGSTIGLGAYYSSPGERGSTTAGVKAAAYFWIFSAIVAWYRVAVYLFEEAFGVRQSKFYPRFVTRWGKQRERFAPGYGEAGVIQPS